MKAPLHKQGSLVILMALYAGARMARNREKSGQKGRINTENRQKRRENRINKAGNGQK